MGHFFHNLAHISRKTDWIVTKILLEIYFWTKKIRNNFSK